MEYYTTSTYPGQPAVTCTFKYPGDPIAQRIIMLALGSAVPHRRVLHPDIIA